LAGLFLGLFLGLCVRSFCRSLLWPIIQRFFRIASLAGLFFFGQVSF
jgi:hypothetical protein